MTESPKSKKEKKLVKCNVPASDHKLIRMAAARQDSTIDAFVAEAAVSKAKKILGSYLPEN